MNSSQFKKNEFKKLCAILGTTPSIVQDITANIESNYIDWKKEKKDKESGELKTYKDGTVKLRELCEPKDRLKAIQAAIKDQLLDPIELPKYVQGGVKKRSNITNAKAHKGNKYQFTTDLQDFYSSVTSKMVYETFVGLKFSTHFAYWLTKLTTRKYALPQGTPTSTHVANLVFLQVDKVLQTFCESNEIVYTRFIDDLTFSSQKDFRQLIPEIVSIIVSKGYKLSHRKTKYAGDQNITGIDVFLNRIDVPDRILEKAISEVDSDTDFKPHVVYLDNVRKTNSKKSSDSKR